MKKIDKFLAVLLALVLCVSLVPAAFASEAAPPTKGSITVNNAIPGQTYKFYRIFDLAVTADHVEGTDSGFLYTVNSAWEGFFTEGQPGLEYVTITNGVVTWKEGVANDAAAVQAFAQAALAYAQENEIEPVRTHTTTTIHEKPSERTSFTEGGLDLGYYLIDSSAGSLVTVNSNDPNVFVVDKNDIPDIDKQVQEDSTGELGTVNDADVDQVVNFQSVVTVYEGSDYNYVVHDKMTNLTFGAISMIRLNGEVLVEGTDYNVIAEGLEDGCTFEIKFTDEFIKKLNESTDDKARPNQVIIDYTATLTEDAYNSKGENDIQLEWGDKNTTVWHHTDTYTGGLSLHKYDGDSVGEDDVATENLAGVTFTLTRQNGETTEYAIVENGFVTGWAEGIVGADGTVTPPEGAILTTDEHGMIDVKGLDEDVYTITEIETLPGYNPLASPITATVTIDDEGKVIVSYKNDGDEEDTTLEDGVYTIPVPNYTGTRLPETGGIGTTVFYIVGGALVLAAVVLLIAKKRMSNKD